MAGVLGFALVRIKLRSQFGFHIIFQRLTRLELRVAMLTDANGNWGSFYDPKVSLWHEASFPQVDSGRQPCGFQTAPLANLDLA